MFDIRDGWHTYWRNPGDSGQATRLAWTLPPGFRAGPIEWTAPHRFRLAQLVNFGYAKRAVHLVQITAPASLSGRAPLTLHAKANWLVCSNLCIPESAELELTLPPSAKPGARDPAAEPLFAAARSELPQRAPAAAAARLDGGRLVLTLGADWGGALAEIESLSFVPYDDGVIEYAAPQIMTRGTVALTLSMKLGYQPPKAGPIRGLLFATQRNGPAGPPVPLEIAASFAATPAVAGTAAAQRFTDAAARPAPSRPSALSCCSRSSAVSC